MYDNNNYNGYSQGNSFSQSYGGQAGQTWNAAYTNPSPATGTGTGYSTPQNINDPQPGTQRPKNGMGVGGKLMVAVCCGLLFGLCAGAGFYAVSLATSNMEQSSAPRIEETIPAADTSSGAPDITYLYDDPNAEHQLVVLTTEESDITTVVADVMPSMVSITEYYTYTTSYWGQTISDEVSASGSGIIIGETEDEYIIVTNNHVVESADTMTVTFIDDTTVNAYLKGTDPSMDVAVISVLKSELEESTISKISVAKLGDSRSLVLGQNVIAIGNALGYGQSVTTGIVSALNREVTTSDGNTNYYIQTDAAINPGNSGGALLNMAGEVIGINSNKIGGSAVEGMGYAIPISSVRDIIEDLMGRDTLIALDDEDTGFIGIYMQEVTAQIAAYYNMPQGVYISDIVADSGADKAGLEVGDIITDIEGNKITSNDSLIRAMRYYAIGDEIEITFMRNENGEYNEHTVTVTLGERPAT